MQGIFAVIKKHEEALVKLLPLLAFAVPILWLYLLDAASFEMMWKGRTFQLFFIWLVALELILDWEKIKPNPVAKSFSARTLAFIVALLLPTMYVVIANYIGLNAAIAAVSEQNGVFFSENMPLAIEYLTFTALFCLIAFLIFGKKGLTGFSVPAFFLGMVGAIYTIDNVYPYGTFAPLQLLVPTTATLAANVLSLMGYTTVYTVNTLPGSGTMPYLTATDPANSARTATFAIAWPCAGIESFLIFTVVALLFLKRMPMSLKAKVGYFAVGAAVTYFINVLRIVTIFIIGVDNGVNSDAVRLFHNYYGPLYSIAWIVAYPLIILGTQSLIHRNAKKPLPVQPNPA
ncbi:MAG: archaeosortase/exosortase family protein [Candidatus Bathyarchaeota archaeon]|nr:archaeosortase/exosortase family protein [Candidatus Bathyarchaeota archaeon]